MAIHRTITTINVEAEPPGYHDGSDEEYPFAIHLSFEVEVEVDPGTEKKEDEARRCFDKFLNGLPSEPKLVVYKIGIDAETIVGSADFVRVSEKETLEYHIFTDWLTKRAAPFNGHLEEDSVELVYDQKVDDQVVSAGHLLRATANWTAPVPHKLALSFVAILQGKQADDALGFGYIPKPKDNQFLWAIGPEGDPTVVLGKSDVSPLDREVKFISEDHSEVFRTRSLLPFKWPRLVLTSGEDAGFLETGKYVVDDFKNLKRLEERSPAQLLTITQLLELEQAVTARVDGMRTPPDSSTPIDSKPLINWFANACILSLMDSILIAFHMPGMPDVEGQILSEWLNCAESSPESMTRSEMLKCTRKALTVPEADQLRIAKQVLGISADNPDFNGEIQSDGNSVPDLINALRALASDLQEESGVERAIIALFETRKEHLVTEFGATDIAKELVNSSLDKFKTELEGSFNGAEAIARSCGLVFTYALTFGRNGSALPTPIIESQFFSRRLRLVSPADDALSTVRDTLWSIDAGDEAKNLAKTPLESALNNIAVTFAPQSDKRFVPDGTPMPLPIRIAPDMDPKKLDEFNRTFNGIGVLIKGDGKWKQACLTQLTTNGTCIEEHALQPFIPTASDGRSPLFIEYQGLPLATQVFAATGDKELASKSGVKTEFFTQQDTDKHGPSALVYGTWYEAASFVVSMSGSLPRALQRDDSPPWSPKKDPGDPPKEACYGTHYLRRTAIGTATIKHSVNSSVDTRRIGTRYPDVFPLAGDYPRHVLGKYEYLDVLRNGDGSGGLDLGSLVGTRLKINLTIDDILSLGTDAKIKLTLHRKQTTQPGEEGILPVDLSLDSPQLVLEFEEGDNTVVFDGNKTATYKINQSDCEPSWLRIQLIKGDAASFALIEGDSSQEYYSAPNDPPVLLLATNDSADEKVWKEPFISPAKFEVVLPRVGFLDFERWIKNNKIDSSHLQWTAVTPESPVEDSFPSIEDVLLYAYLMRAMDAELAFLLDRLPDPAVMHVLVELLPSDTVNDSNAVAPQIIQLKLPEPPSELKKSIGSWLPSDFVKLFCQWDRAYRLSVEASCATTGLKVPASNITDDKIEVTLEAGNVNRFSVRPLVPKKFFNNKVKKDPAPLDPDLKQLAVGQTDKDVLFSGAEILVESLWDGLSELSLAAFKPRIKPMQVDRSYLIETIGVDMRSHRIVSDMQVHTRAWRFSGRPIYNWIDPKAVTNEKTAAIMLEYDPKVAQFENELDFGRDSADFDSAPLQRLLPAPNATVLRKVDWNSPTANYFRHRYTIYSRYRGAMVNGMKSRHLFEGNTWQHRVAMLAKATRTDINRPQLRAIIPLTSPPEVESTSTPPLACVLQENPFAFAGLAERVLAGIQVGLGYQFQEPGPAKSLQLLDTRKEIGKDPRFTVHAMEAEHARAAYLLNEGPIGLHFDRSEASAPAWANSQFILYPRMLLDEFANDLPSETFVAVRMLRMLDSAWVHEPEVTVTSAHFDLNRAWQARFQQEGSMRCNKAIVCQVAKADSSWTVSVSGKHLDPHYKPRHTDTGFLKLCSASTSHINAISLIHRAFGEGNYALLVLGHPVVDSNPAKRIEAGESNAPRVLAEINWQLTQIDQQTVLKFEGITSVSAFYGSASTERQWARTAQNSNVVYVEGEPVTTDALTINQTGGVLNSKGKRVDPHATPAEKNVPQTVHRHLLLVYTQRAKGMGRRTDVYHTAKLFVGGTWPKVQGANTLRVGEIQVSASPIAALPVGLNSVPTQYTKVMFDRVAIGATEYEYFLFVFRPVVEPSADFTIQADYGVGKLLPLIFQKAKQSPTAQVVTVEKGQEPISVTLATDEKNETWFDVSMYPLKKIVEKPEDIDFDFDWLFTSAGGELDYRSAVTKSGLNTNTYEAIAQLVSWSSPIERD